MGFDVESRYTRIVWMLLLARAWMSSSQSDATYFRWFFLSLVPFENRICAHTTHFPSQFTGYAEAYMYIFSVWHLHLNADTNANDGTTEIFNVRTLMISESYSLEMRWCRQTNYDWVNINKLNRVQHLYRFITAAAAAAARWWGEAIGVLVAGTNGECEPEQCFACPHVCPLNVTAQCRINSSRFMFANVLVYIYIYIESLKWQKKT